MPGAVFRRLHARGIRGGSRAQSSKRWRPWAHRSKNRFGREREAASEALDFERAAAIHKKLEKVAERDARASRNWRGRVDATRCRHDAARGRGQTRSHFLRSRGIIAEPFFLRFDELSSQPRSVEAIMREHLEMHSPVWQAWRPSHRRRLRRRPQGHRANATEADLKAPIWHCASVPDELPEHLSLLARWFYAKPREGEIFFRETDGRIAAYCAPARAFWPPASAAPLRRTSSSSTASREYASACRHSIMIVAPRENSSRKQPHPQQRRTILP